MDFKESQTYANLLTAFAGESQARNKYSYFGAKAKQEGYIHIQKILEEIAINEKAHAEIWYKLINNEKAESTHNSLAQAAEGEHYEWSTMYASFAETAKLEGYDKIAYLFSGVASIEREHERLFRKYIDELEMQTTFDKSEKTIWKCGNCGHEQTGNSAPKICAICGKNRKYFAPIQDMIS